MIQINEKRLFNDLCFTANEMYNDSSNRFIRRNYTGFSVLNESMLFNFGKILLINGILDIEKLNEIYDKRELQAFNSFINFLNDNQDTILAMSKNYTKYLNRIKYNLYPFSDKCRRYSEKDFKDLLLGYFSTYGNDIYKIAKKYFDEERIHFNCITDESDCAGYFTGLQWLESGYIFAIFDILDSKAASALAHELGHAIDFERFNCTQKKDIPIFSDCLGEVPSTTFELGFNDYLKDNYIDIDGSELLNNNKIKFAHLCFNELKEALSKEEIELLEDGYGVDENGDVYDIRNSVLYGLGYYFSLHLNLINKEDPKEFLKVFNNMLTLRKEMPFNKFVELMGISVEDFVSAKLIKPKIKSNSLELKKRYKY